MSSSSTLKALASASVTRSVFCFVVLPFLGCLSRPSRYRGKREDFDRLCKQVVPL